MFASGQARPALHVGVDAGGTWVRLAAYRGERPVARLAVAARRGSDLRDLLRAIWRRRHWRGQDVGALVVASRGVWSTRERLALASHVQRLARRVRVLSDAQAALLGALGPRPGLLVLAGTGSIVVGRDRRGRWERAGGLGPLLGDEGSAFWLGREWLRLTSRGEDFYPARRLVTSADPVGRIAALAPVVLRRARRGDRRAGAIVRAGQAHLAEGALSVVRRLGLPPPVTVSWAGSVLGDRWFRAGLMRAVARLGVRARWVAPAAEPVEAAARLGADLLRRRPGRRR